MAKSLLKKTTKFLFVCLREKEYMSLKNTGDVDRKALEGKKHLSISSPEHNHSLYSTFFLF